LFKKTYITFLTEQTFKTASEILLLNIHSISCTSAVSGMLLEILPNIHRPLTYPLDEKTLYFARQ